MTTSYRLTGRQVTLAHSSTASKIVYKILEDENYDLKNESSQDLENAANEMNIFLEDIWFQLGDTAFNRSGLRNATDKLIDFLSRKEYYYKVPNRSIS